MPRNFKPTSRYQKPDPKYDNALASKFINCLMWDGKKSTAQAVFYEALATLKERFPKENEIDVFVTAINNVKPQIEVRSKRVGGATYQVPMQVSPRRQQSLAIRWVLDAARGKKGKPMARKLADQFTDAFNREGDAVKKRENVHKMADANKAFAHFAW
ncbi:MAG: 30S ribosomal protein S7 [Planctomycetota bacterium]